MVKKAVQKLYLGNQEVNLATSGVYPEGTINITENGVYDVTTYKNANVKAGPDRYIPLGVDNSTLVRGGEDASKLNMAGVTNIGAHTLENGLTGAVGLTGAPFENYSGLTQITNDYAIASAFKASSFTRTGLEYVTELSGNYTCYEAYKESLVTTPDLGNLETIDGSYVCNSMFKASALSGGVEMLNLTSISGVYACAYMFANTNITQVSMDNLGYITGTNACRYMFENCPNFTNINLGNVSAINSDYMFYYMFSNSGLQSLNFNNITSVTAQYACAGMCNGCASLERFYMSSLNAITGKNAFNITFNNCTSLVEADLSGVETIGVVGATSSANNYQCQSTFKGCTALTTVNLSRLRTIQGYNTCQDMFWDSGLRTQWFESLETITGTGVIGYMFEGCSYLEDVYFPKLTTYTTPQANTFTGNYNQPPRVHFRVDAPFKSNSVLIGNYGGKAQVLFDIGDFPVHFEFTDSGYEFFVSHDGGAYASVPVEYNSDAGRYVATFQGVSGGVINFITVRNGTMLTTGWVEPAQEETYNGDIDPNGYVYGVITPDSNYPNDVSYSLQIANTPVYMHCTSGGEFKFYADMTSLNNLGVSTLTGTYNGVDSYPPYTDYLPTGGAYDTWTVNIQTLIEEQFYTGDIIYNSLNPYMGGDSYWTADPDEVWVFPYVGTYQGTMTIHPEIATTYTACSGFQQIQTPEGATRAKLYLYYELGSEVQYDWGYLCLGFDTITPARTSSQVKNQTITDGIYLFRLDGSHTSGVQEVEIELTDMTYLQFGQPTTVTVGWAQDTSTSSNGNYFKIYGLRVEFY